MKRIEFTNIFDQRKVSTHIRLSLLVFIIALADLFLNPESMSVARFIGVFVLIFAQVEVFLLLARAIFTETDQGMTPGKFTKTVLLRLGLFLVLCYVAAFLIIIAYLHFEQLITRGTVSGILTYFFQNSLRAWFKSTSGGLLFGTAIFIIILWQDALKRQQKLREENLVFQNATLMSQVNPHFLFNSLNTLSSLIASQPDIAEKFTAKLSAIYRYILENSSRERVSLREELSFIRDFIYLHQIRGDGKIELQISLEDTIEHEILPVSLQILAENAIKHNRATREEPLKIEIRLENGYIAVGNNLQRMSTSTRSTGIGLKNLSLRTKLISGKDLIIDETEDYFVVKVPLL